MQATNGTRWQRDEQSVDFKPMPSIGRGVGALCAWDDSGTYRIVCAARLADQKSMPASYARS